jgi:hypothetical protein
VDGVGECGAVPGEPVNRKPLYPEHGMVYDVAMMEAEEEYKAWLKSRKGKKGMKVFAVRSNKMENTDADI